LENLYKQQDTTIIDFEVRFKVKWSAEITNIGNSLGKIYATGSRDTLSDNPIIREYFLRRTVNLHYWNIEGFPHYYKNEINPGDTTDISTEYEIHYIDIEKQFFTIHMLLLYENDIGNLFDTYIWSVHDVAISEFFLYILPSEDQKKIIRKLGVKPDIDIMKTPKKLLHSFHIYTPKDAEFIKEFFIKLGDDLSGSLKL
jgi:hypothetical protein